MYIRNILRYKSEFPQILDLWPSLQIGEYDSEDGELWEDDDDDDDSGDSWETESEHSTSDIEDPAIVKRVSSWNSEDNDMILDEGNVKSKLAANIEKVRLAMARLEEIFGGNPTLQTAAIMKQLLDVYKDCRKLDKLMGTTFFEEENFEGLIEKLRGLMKYPQMGHQQALKNQVTRLFSVSSQDEGPEDNTDWYSKMSFNNPEKMSNVSQNDDAAVSLDMNNGSENEKSSIKYPKYIAETAKNTENNLPYKTGENIDCDKGFKYLNEGENMATQTCSRLCSLVKAQLVKSHEEVTMRYGGQAGAFTKEDLTQSPGEEDADLGEIMSQILKESSFSNVVTAFDRPDNRVDGLASDVLCSPVTVKMDTNYQEKAKESRSKEAEESKLKRGVSAQDISGRCVFSAPLMVTG